MYTIDSLTAPFLPISLDRMDQVKLMNRVDSKFVFRLADLPEVLGQMHSCYYILEIDGIRLQHYETLYFDTPDHRLYLNHHNKRANRFKVRSRLYADSGACYFEIKFKNNKGRTEKLRNKHKGVREEITGKQAELLASGTGFTPDMLQPALWVCFTRITLVNHGLTERITIDTSLSFRNGKGECTYPGIVIAELKQDRSESSFVSGLLHRHHIRGTRMSKYCLGIASTDQRIKQNNFKRKLHYINKLNHDTR